MQSLRPSVFVFCEDLTIRLLVPVRRCVEWSMKFAVDSLLLRVAEREAKQARRRMFKDWVAPGEGPNAIQDAEFEATLTEARSGDTVVITKAGGETETITLSSIRAPKLGNARRQAPYEDFSWDAREFVRKYVGKKCLACMPKHTQSPSTSPLTLFQAVPFPRASDQSLDQTRVFGFLD